MLYKISRGVPGDAYNILFFDSLNPTDSSLLNLNISDSHYLSPLNEFWTRFDKVFSCAIFYVINYLLDVSAGIYFREGRFFHRLQLCLS